ncbi:MAG: energy-coupling factor ABC transporter permease [Granulosicoccaceae bacterium]
MSFGALALVLMAVYFALLLLAIRYVDWRALARDTGLQHRLGVAAALLIVLWSLRAGISDGLEIHFFMVSALHLVFGWQLAMLVVTVALLALTVLGSADWYSLGLSGIVSGVLPILCTFAFWKLHKAKTPHNPFAFIFLVASLGAVVATVVSALFLSTVLWLNGDVTLTQLQNELWIFLPLMALPEGAINGMLIAAMIVYVPDWVKLFEERRYK